MAERRYDEDETQAIFDRASRVPTPSERSTTPTTGHDFTLAELQDIGVEAGIDPERIAAAARSLDTRAATQPPARRLAGLPVSVARTVELPGDFDEDDWNRLVVDLRETFAARGRIRVEGAFREWNNGNLQALVEPGDEGYRLRLRTVKGSAYRIFSLGTAGILMSLFFVAAFFFQGRLDEKWLAAAFLGSLGVGSMALTAIQLPGWARTRERQMEEVASRALLRAGRPDDGDG